MIAPDKIYIPIIEEDGKKLLCTNWWGTDTSSRNAYVNETIPYIRKDALIEWLLKGVEMSEICHSEYGDACAQAYQAVIDKLNSMEICTDF